MKLVQLFKQTFATPTLVGVTEEAEQERNRLAVAAQAVTTILNSRDQDRAVTVARDIRTHVKAVQDYGRAYRAPLTEFSRQVKGVEDDHIAPLTMEQARLERLIVAFQEKEARRVAEAERKRQEEIQRAERERAEAEAKAKKALESAKTDKQLDKAIKLEAEANKAEEAWQTVVRGPLPEAAKASGVALKKVLCWECLDVAKLYAARPELCKVEPKPSAIQSVCIAKQGATVNEPDTESVPGLALWWDVKASARTR